MSLNKFSNVLYYIARFFSNLVATKINNAKEVPYIKLLLTLDNEKDLHPWKVSEFRVQLTFNCQCLYH